MQVYGRPILIRLDVDGAFRSREFIAHMEDFGLNVEKVPAEAHWKNGICERLVLLHKTTVEGLARAHPDMPLQELFDLASWAHMHGYSHRGYTPGQLLIGATPEALGPDPLSDDPNLATLTADPAGHMAATLQRQASGMECHRVAMASDRLRRAAIARTRQFAVWPPGCVVWYWRERRVRMKHKHG